MITTTTTSGSTATKLHTLDTGTRTPIMTAMVLATTSCQTEESFTPTTGERHSNCLPLPASALQASPVLRDLPVRKVAQLKLRPLSHTGSSHIRTSTSPLLDPIVEGESL